MGFRIYVDESGTHDSQWLIIGMLFVPDHGALHAALCRVKDDLEYFNRSPNRSARYKEIHLAHFRSDRDLAVSKRWIDEFNRHSCYFRCVVIDWSVWQGRFFGDPFEPDSLKKRRAYKKWAEMLLQPEIAPGQIHGASLYLDRLNILYGYDVLDHLTERFTRNYQGNDPYIKVFQHVDSGRDAHQCLQLCDLLTGCVYQALVPARNAEKRATKKHLEDSLAPYGIQSLSAGFWQGFAPLTLTQRFPKFTAWFWRPTGRR